MKNERRQSRRLAWCWAAVGALAVALTALGLILERCLAGRARDVMTNPYFLTAALLTFASLTALLAVTLVWQHRSRKRLRALAFVDPLTGGPNYPQFLVDVEDSLERQPERPYALLSLDIDGFTAVNARHGLPTGDKLLCRVADALTQECLPDECAARVAADQFALLLRCPSPEALSPRVERLLERLTGLCAPLWDQAAFSCGIYRLMPQEDRSDLRALLERASLARESVKDKGERSYAFYRQWVQDQALRERRLEADMGAALQEREFVVYFQPKYGLTDGGVVGAEALVRWQKPDMGLLLPGEFIPLFERNGLIARLDAYVLEEVCRLIRDWKREGRQVVPISVNVSQISLRQASLTERYAAIMDRYGLTPEELELEVTESALHGNMEEMVTVVKCLKRQGYHLSLDDFGTGYSSLQLLRELPVDVLKLDRSFLNGIFQSERGQDIIIKIVELAKAVQMQVVSEGVETDDQASFLRNHGFDVAQGYLFARPMPPQELAHMLPKVV